MKPLLANFLIISLVLTISSLQLATVDADPSFCDSKCAARCDNAGVMKRCLTYCGICCKKCSCVPSGTVGNKSECPCYRDMLNSKGRSKCP